MSKKNHKRITSTSCLSATQKARIYQLWNTEFTAGVSYKDLADFESFLKKWEHPRHLLLLDEDGQLQGWMFLFDRDGGRWFSMLLAPAIQGQGYGSQLLRAAQQTETQLLGWVVDDDNHLKLDGSGYRSPLNFYLKNGFEVHKEERFESEVLSAVKVSWVKE